jgi:hypothetical protein
VGNWKQYQNRLPTDQELIAWWQQPQQGIGVITGAASGGLEALEIEGRAWELGVLSQVEALLHDSGYGELWNTLMDGYCERSPSGGYHWLYKISDKPVPGNEVFARTLVESTDENTGEITTQWKPLAETRGEGGFMITAPSGGTTHPSGLSYQLEFGGIETIPTITWEQREIIASAFRLMDERPAAESETTYTPSHTHQGDTLRAGDAYDAQTSWDDLLPAYGWTRGTTRADGTTEWARPHKPLADGISATTNHTGGGRFPHDRLYVYSTSAGLPTGKFLTKFQVKTLMDFGGDYSACAKQLRADGYGNSAPALNQFSALPALSMSITSAEPDSDAEAVDSWIPIDWDMVMTGNDEPKQTTILMRTDGVALLYPNSINQIFGESESGKSLTAAYAIASRIQTFGDNALIIDNERDEREWRDRLNLFGCTDEQIRRHVIYVRPDVAPTDSFKRLLANSIQVCVIDSVSASLATFGGDTNSNDSITQWTNALPRQIVKHTQACVIVIDHQAKNTQTRGRFAVGSQAKLATITGAAYEASMTEPLGKGLRGVVTLKLAKDAASGGLRQHVGAEKPKRLFEAAQIVFDSTQPDAGIRVEVLPPSGAKSHRPTALMAQTSQILEANPDGLTQNQLYEQLGKAKGNQSVVLAWSMLLNECYIGEKRGMNNGIIRYSMKPYRQSADPLSDRFTGQQPLQPFVPHVQAV